MKYRRLGKTNLEVSEVGHGGAGIGHAWGAITDEECVRTVERALELGVNFFDTSPVYGNGQSEINLGKGIVSHRNDVVIASKVRLRTADHLSNMRSAIRESLDNSFERLGTDYVDILQIHHQIGVDRGQYMSAVGPPPRYAYRLDENDAVEISEVLDELIAEGKLQYKGITAWDGDGAVIQNLLDSGRFDTAQILYNVLNQTSLVTPPEEFADIDQGQTLEAAHENDIGVIGIRSHAAGALCESLDRDVDPESEVMRDFQKSSLIKGYRDDVFATISQIATRFCLDNSGIHTVIPGVKTIQELEEVVLCSEMPSLPDDVIASLETLHQSNFRTVS